MRNYFTLDGADSRTYGVYISGAGTYSAPARRYQVFQVPGRNGDLIISDDSFENGTLLYSECFIKENVDTKLASFRAFLMSRQGYVDLTDTYHPNERRQVIFTGSFDPEPTKKLDAVKFNLEFSCKPQRWLLSGDNVTTVNNGGTGGVTNPTKFPAKPLLKIYGNGSFDYSFIDTSGAQPLIVTTTITLDTVGTSQKPVFIDTETMYIYQESINGVLVNRSSFVTISTTDIPVIRPEDTVTISNVTCTKVEVVPRWWTL
jgi:phage-related protein